MLYGLNNNEKILPYPSVVAYCPECGGKLISKCGKINKWHFSHESNNNCGGEPETEWHRDWKSYVDIDNCEVIIEKNGVKKIADAVIKNTVVEFQHSHISVDEIIERENFYENMIWVFDCIEAYEKGRFIIRDSGKYSTFRWKHAKKSISFCTKPVYLDFGNIIFRLKKMYDKSPVGGWGYYKEKDVLIDYLQPALYNFFPDS